MRKLYVTEWAPNGCNDLLVVEKQRIVASVEAATFGIDVCKSTPREKATAYGAAEVFTGHISAEEYDPEFNCLLKRVSKEEIRKHFCISPVDPRGIDLFNRLKAAGVDLAKGEK